MKKIISTIALILAASTTQAAQPYWLICETPGEAPNIDFTIENKGDSGGTILMTVTQMSGEAEIFKTQVGPKTLASAQQTQSASSLVLVSEQAEVDGEAFASKAAMVTINKGVAKVAMNGGAYKKLKCSQPR